MREPAQLSTSIWRPDRVFLARGLCSCLFLMVLIVCCSAASADVSFSGEIAPVLAERCIRCHGATRQRADLDLDSFSGLMDGGETGRVVQSGDPENSLLIQKLRGEAKGERMPPNGAAISDDTIEVIQAWIRQGAKFDGPDQGLRLRQLTAAYRLRTSSPQQLRQAAIQAAQKDWRLAFPNEQPQLVHSDHFLLVGRAVGMLQTVAKRAEDALDSAWKSLSLTKYQLKSPLVVYVLANSYDRVEFQKMVEDRTSEAGGTHWHPGGGLGYVVVSASGRAGRGSRTKSIVSEGELIRVVTAISAFRIGAPIWYADAMGQVALAKEERRAPIVRRWQTQIRPALSQAKKAGDIFDGKLPSAQMDAITWALGSFLTKDKRRARRLHHALGQGMAFEQAFAGAYGQSPKDYCNAWLARYRQ